MTVIAFDAVESIKELKSVGFTEDQAETQVKVLLDAIRKTETIHFEEFATKHDLKELELRITEVIADVRREVANVQREVANGQREVANLQREVVDVRREIAESKTEIIKWIAGMLVVQSGILIGGFFAVIKLLLT
jgi:chromosome segregation ATPase